MDMRDMQGKLEQLQKDPMAMAKQAGFNVPDEMANDPRAMVQHLIMTGQVASPVLQRIMPMLQRMAGK